MNHLLIYITALILGLRHGIDWDHIAAITDISGSQESKRKSFQQAMTYAAGHASIIITFGLLAVALGVQLPGWVDTIMEPVVGVTLVILGAWLLITIFLQRKNFKMMSRWMLLFRGIKKMRNFIHHKFSKHALDKHAHIEVSDSFSTKSAFLVGMLHGIGAETPTQLLIFVTAAGAGGALIGSLLVLSFVIGLLISNATVTMLAIFGFSSVQKNPLVYLGLGSISGAFSLVVGFIFLTGHAFVLPAILGG
jgi:high-affinity nickel-transport protein